MRPYPQIPSVLPRSTLPRPKLGGMDAVFSPDCCQAPCLRLEMYCGSRRIAAMTSAHVSSAGATGEPGALPHEHDDVSVFEADGQLAQPLDGVGVDLGGVRVEPGCAVELADCVLVVVENHNVHPDIVPWPRRSFHTGPPPGT